MIQAHDLFEVLLGLGATEADAGKWAAVLPDAMQTCEINTSKRVAAFLGQCAHESALFRKMEEDLAYSAPRLCVVFPSRFPNLAAAQPFAFNPEAFANQVYGGRLGNSSPGDGYIFRGRGLLQVTGRDNYTALGREWLCTPEGAALRMMKPEGAALGSAWWWVKHHCNQLADAWDLTQLTRTINGGTLGLSERIALCSKALRLLEGVTL